jgi:hypothetical protein
LVGKILEKKGRLTSSPEGETDGVVDLVLGQVLGDLELSNNSRAVIVDTSTDDGVSVATELNNVVLVTTTSSSKNVGGGTVLKDGVDVEGGEDWTGLDVGEKGLTSLLGDTGNWDVWSLWARWGTESSGELTGGVVVDDSTLSTGSASKSDLETELAGTTGDQSDLASGLSWEIGLIATATH